ncbi:MAG: hypothetical protein ABR497_08560, partial [Kiritimatiellia bacterium]
LCTDLFQAVKGKAASSRRTPKGISANKKSKHSESGVEPPHSKAHKRRWKGKAGEKAASSRRTPKGISVRPDCLSIRRG